MKFGNYSLSPLTLADAHGLLDLINNSRTRIGFSFPGTTSSVKDIDSAKKFIKAKIEQAKKRESLCFAIRDDKRKRIVGMLYVLRIEWTVPKAEIGYYIDVEYEGKGITTKGVSKVIQYCFSELKMNKLYLRTSKGNIASQRVAEKNGFKQEGFLRKDFRDGRGKLVDLLYYGLVKPKK